MKTKTNHDIKSSLITLANLIDNLLGGDFTDRFRTDTLNHITNKLKQIASEIED